MAPKRKAIPEDATSPESSPASPTGTSRPLKRSRPELPVTEAIGWVLHYPYMMLSKTYGKPEARSKIAGFELDGTLVGNKKEVGRSVPDPENWRFANNRVKEVVRELVADGFALVIFTNQGWVQGALDGKAAVKVKGRIDNILQELDVPAHVLAATAHSKACDPFRKPAVGMWKYFEAACNAGQAIVLEESVFVGSAAGRIKDFADSDIRFAMNVQLPFKTPEEVFGVLDIKRDPPTVKGGENHNSGLELALQQLAAKREAEGGGSAFYKSRALQNTADIVKTWPEKIQSSQDVADIKGIGKGSQYLIDEFIRDGKFAALDAPKHGALYAAMAAV